MKQLVKVDVELMPPGQYARRVISRARFKPTFLVPCAKPDGLQPAESPLERDAHFILNVSPDVGPYRAQAAIITIHYVEGGVSKTERTYPDLLVVTRSGRSFIEVKTESDAALPATRERTALLACGLPREGFDYQVWTENEIRKPAARLTNARLLVRLGRGQQPSLVEMEFIRKTLVERQVVEWGEVRAGLLGRKGLHHACRLVMDGVLHADICAPITDRTQIRWAAAEIRPPPIG